MRKLTTIAVLVATAAISVSGTPAHAGQQAGGTSDPVVGFTPPIGSEHGSVRADPLSMNGVATGPANYELDIMW